jgi:hypothetical protein
MGDDEFFTKTMINSNFDICGKTLKEVRRWKKEQTKAQDKQDFIERWNNEQKTKLQRSKTNLRAMYGKCYLWIIFQRI